MQEMIDLLLQVIYAHNFQAELKNQVHHVHNIFFNQEGLLSYQRKRLNYFSTV